MAERRKDAQKASVLCEEGLANEESRTGEDGGDDEGITKLDNNISKSKNNSVSELDERFPSKLVKVQYPDPEFGDFDKDRAEHCFTVDQIWAFYDETDGMPRFYAKIEKIISPCFRLRIAWLEPTSDNEVEQELCDAEMPVTCGKYATGCTEEIDDVRIFSHQMCVNRIVVGSYLIHPKKRETWALFKNWSIEWRSDPKSSSHHFIMSLSRP